jgi:ABC-type transporter Mla MlaB component
MLRAEFHQLTNGLILKLEGRLVGEWAIQVKSLVANCSSPTSLAVDLSEVTYADSAGEQLLTWLCSLHAKFIAETCYARDVCERLHLTLEAGPDRRLATSSTDV